MEFDANTLPAISLGLGLHRNTLGVLKGRHDDFPEPVASYGANGGVAIY